MAKKTKVRFKPKPIFISLDFIKYLGISVAGLVLLSGVFYFVTVRGDIFQLLGAAVTCSAEKEEPVLELINEEYDGNTITFEIRVSDNCGINRVIVEENVFEGMNMQTAVFTTVEHEYTVDNAREKITTLSFRVDKLNIRGGIVQYRIRALDVLGNPSNVVTRSFEI